MSYSDERDLLISKLLERLDRVEHEVAQLRDSGGRAASHEREPGKRSHGAVNRLPADDRLPRRALLGRAGAIVAGSVVAGTAATVLDASPAAAAQGNFDTAAAGSYALGAVVNGGVAANGVQVSPGAAGTGVNVIGASSAAAVLGNAAPSLNLSSASARGSLTGVNTAGSAGAAVLGLADSPTFGWGVAGRGSYVGVGGSGGSWDVRLTRSSAIGFGDPLTGVEHGPAGDAPNNAAGDLAKDDNGDLWFCTAMGTAATGTFRKVSGPGVAGSLHLLSAPKRVYDSRLGGEVPLDDNERAINVTTIGPGLPGAGTPSGVPTAAGAVLVNLTATGTVGTGYLAIWRNGIAWPGHSNLNWSVTGTNIANECSSATTAGVARVKASGETDVVLDIIGYYR